MQDPEQQQRQQLQFTNAWRETIDEFALLALQAGISYNEYRQIKETLYHWIDLAVAKKERIYGK